MRKVWFISALLFLTGACRAATAQAVIVDVQGSISTVQEGINRAQPHDTLFIKKGTYREFDIEIDKPLTLIGEEGSIIDGEKKGFVFIITADSVTLKKLEVRNSSSGFIKDFAGIIVENANHTVLEQLTLTNNYFGIYVARSQGIIIRDNLITASGQRETSSGNGIHLWSSENVHITNNVVTGHRDGLYLQFAKNATITHNTSRDNIRYGIHFMYSDSCHYEANIFRNNGAGVAVMYTSNTEIINNVFEDNWGSSAYGLLLKEINRSHVEGNRFANNSVAMYLEASSRNTITGNTFTQNGWAVKLMANSTDNMFSGNNFIANSFEVSTNSRQHFNTFDGNYWSQYEGYDLNKDGIGDVPHRPVRLFSILIERQPQALLLLRSLLVDILDAAETLMPHLTPKTLIDENPKMAEIL